MKQPCVYIVTNQRNGTLYTGVTSNLIQGVYQHKERIIKGFSQRYNCNMLVWFEIHETMEAAITREKQIKGGSRKQKMTLIESQNPEWKDLFETVI